MHDLHYIVSDRRGEDGGHGGRTLRFSSLRAEHRDDGPGGGGGGHGGDRWKVDKALRRSRICVDEMGMDARRKRRCAMDEKMVGIDFGGERVDAGVQRVNCI